jgi:putative oxidoreductase
MGLFKKCNEKYGKYAYLVFRVLVGFLFLQHGLQKLFGMFGGMGGSAAPLMSLMGLAGLIEFAVGLGLIFAVFTRLAAAGGALLMLIAYFMMHYGNGWPIQEMGGELALLYLAAFLALKVHGSGIWSLEKHLLGKETF